MALQRSDYLTIPEAAEFADVTPETVRLWISSGRLSAGSDPEVVELIRSTRSDTPKGRPPKRYVLRADVEPIVEERSLDLGDDAIHVDNARRALMVSKSTFYRLRAKLGLTQVWGPGGMRYLSKRELAALVPGRDFRSSASPADLDAARRKYLS